MSERPCCTEPTPMRGIIGDLYCLACDSPLIECDCAAHHDGEADCTCYCPLYTHVGDISDDGPCR